MKESCVLYLFCEGWNPGLWLEDNLDFGGSPPWVEGDEPARSNGEDLRGVELVGGGGEGQDEGDGGGGVVDDGDVFLDHVAHVART